MIENPRILISNDDGIDAPGLACLRKIASCLSDDVWVVAPLNNQSGVGHCLTLGSELYYTQKSERVFALNGTPADCVIVACTDLLKDKRPDIVLAGVNHGQNLGDIINCSGTLAAAREGALQGALGIALSQGIDYENQADVLWHCTEKFAAEVLQKLIDQVDNGTKRNPDIYYNMNFPICAQGDVSGIEFVPHQRFTRSAFQHYPSRNEGKFFVSIPQTPTPMQEGHDFYSLHRDNAISITPLSLRQSDLAEIERLKGIVKLDGR